MPRFSFDFLTLHYAWIILCGLLSLVVILPYGNVSAVDAYFFGASASTESGLNTVDVKDLKTYQQLFIYVIPIITNLGFINIIVVVVRIGWFKRKFKFAAQSMVSSDPKGVVIPKFQNANPAEATAHPDSSARPGPDVDVESLARPVADAAKPGTETTRSATVTYRIPPPRDRDEGQPIVPLRPHSTAPADHDEDDDPKSTLRTSQRANLQLVAPEPGVEAAKSVGNIASSMFVLGRRISTERRMSQASHQLQPSDLPSLSRQVTIGRNSQFFNLTAEDEEKLGGIEFRALKLLLRFIIGYFAGIHALGVICLVAWIHNAPEKYTAWLAECGQDRTWWAFYSAQTMVSNLGFTLTPDSMVTFRDATLPILVMTFLAFAGNTLYPVFLRLTIWIAYRFAKAGTPRKETLKFLLDHPRRCYTLLFPSRPTWILFGIISLLNVVDVLFIILLDLDNPAVNDLPAGPRILSALFQAASTRHTGTATLNLANVNPAVQFSLLVMMYIAILPIAISVRASNTYEEQALGIYDTPHALDESRASSYIMKHVRNQLSFDLWYIFLGTFCICVAESTRIADTSEPSFSVFSVFFETVSAYANVGLSLGHPTVMTSLAGQFTTFSKVVICLAMIRGRHRGLPYALDRAIMLPGENRHNDDARLMTHSVSKLD